MRIGFIGLGNMGAGMAANLANAGHAVAAFDLAADAVARAVAAGCTAAASAAEAVASAEAVITMLPDGGIVARVFADEVLGHAPAGALLIDCSTIDVATAREVAGLAAEAGFAMADAPVSGGIGGANAGTLTFMVGASDAGFARAQPILAAMGKAVIHAGGPGAGQAAKICNNMALGIHMLGTCEAFATAQRLGLDPQTFYDIISVSSGQSWSVTTYCPVPGIGPASPADRGYEGGFAAALMLKDLRLALAAASSAGIGAEMAAQAEQIYAAFAAAGNGNRDFSAIIESL